MTDGEKLVPVKVTMEAIRELDMPVKVSFQSTLSHDIPVIAQFK